MERKFSLEETQEEQSRILSTFRQLKFGHESRKNILGCWNACGLTSNIRLEIRPYNLEVKNEQCLYDCLNVTFEKGPFLNQLGEVPAEKIPKRFVWTSDFPIHVPDSE